VAQELTIGNCRVGLDHPPLIIAEMSGNHNQSLERALEIVVAVAKSGAQALKLQTYTADTITIDLREGEFFIRDENSLWNGSSLYELYQQAHTPWEWHAPIMKRATELGLICFSSPFDETAVEFLDSIGVPAFKIASFENNHLPLIRKVAHTGKPLIISSGMATLSGLDEAVTAAREAGCRDLVLLKCTSSYPASATSSNLATIPYMRENFRCEVGLSDHTLGIGAAIASVALGATVIEKHVTLSRADGGVDSVFSLEPHELAQLVAETRVAWEARGTVTFGPTEQEKASLVYRRSLYVCENMAAGEVFTGRNLRAIRPGLGLAPKFIDCLLGRHINRAVKRGTPATWDLIG
jgi:N-acetylneuraminate synthase